MAPPYASVIVPTHDRAATLRLAIQSIQRQTVSDIEIIILGDGATSAVTEVAHTLAAEDSRVKFVAREKGSGAGGSNRHFAVADVASAERVFYSDDDDLWLPQHIEIIGPHLDNSDVVDTLPVSVTTCARLALAPVNSGNEFTRKLLADGTLKLMYDTHLAHRRSTYLELDRPWAASARGDIVRRMLGAFAEAEQVTWTTLPVSTALSLTGGARATYTPTQRQKENELWFGRLAAFQPHELARAASPVWQFQFALRILAPESGDTLQSYLARLGLRLPGVEVEGAMELPLREESESELQTVFDAHLGNPVQDGQLAAVVPRLVDNASTALVNWGWVRQPLSRLSAERFRRVLESFPADDERSTEVRAILEAYFLKWHRRYGESLDISRPLVAKLKSLQHEAEILVGETLIEMGQPSKGIPWLRKAAAREQRPSAIAARLVNALVTTGRIGAAEHELKSLETRLGGMPYIDRLRQRIDEAKKQLRPDKASSVGCAVSGPVSAEEGFRGAPAIVVQNGAVGNRPVFFLRRGARLIARLQLLIYCWRFARQVNGRIVMLWTPATELSQRFDGALFHPSYIFDLKRYYAAGGGDNLIFLEGPDPRDRDTVSVRDMEHLKLAEGGFDRAIFVDKPLVFHEYSPILSRFADEPQDLAYFRGSLRETYDLLPHQQGIAVAVQRAQRAICDPYVALHVRRGDVWEHLRHYLPQVDDEELPRSRLETVLRGYVNRTTLLESYCEPVEAALRDGRKVVFFSDTPSTYQFFAERFGSRRIVNAARFAPTRLPIQKAFIDFNLLMNADSIIGTSGSAFSAFAAMIGAGKLHNVLGTATLEQMRQNLRRIISHLSISREGMARIDAELDNQYAEMVRDFVSPGIGPPLPRK